MKSSSYFPHDSNAKDDPKIVLVIESLNPEGYGIFWILIELLKEQPDFKYPLQLLPSIARRYNTTYEKVKSVVFNFGLFEIENEMFFYSCSLINRMSEIADKKLKQSEGGKKAMLNRWKLNKNELQEYQNTDNLVISNLYDTNKSNDKLVITSKVKESKVKESKVKESKVKENSNFFFKISNKTIFEKIDDYIKTNFQIWLDSLNFRFKDKNIQAALQVFATAKNTFDFENENHLKNSFEVFLKNQNLNQNTPQQTNIEKKMYATFNLITGERVEIPVIKFQEYYHINQNKIDMKTSNYKEFMK